MSPEPAPPARPDVGPREEELVREVLRSGRLSLGPMLDRFEESFAAWIGAPAVAVSSGTAALHLAVRAQGWGAGDEVVTSPLSFVASANCLLYEGRSPVFCDIDARTLNMNAQAAAAACGERTAGLLPVHLFGYPADMEALESIAQRRGLGIVEDACEALGAVDAAGRRIGASGHPAAFGFYANKQLVTGEGGMLTLRRRRRARAGAQRAQPGPRGATWTGSRTTGSASTTASRTWPPRSASHRWSALDDLLAARARVAGLYRERLGAIDGLALPCGGRGRRAPEPVRVRGAASRRRRSRRRDPTARRGPASPPRLTCRASISSPSTASASGIPEGDFPIAEDVAARSVALPFFTTIAEPEVERVATALEAAL